MYPYYNPSEAPRASGNWKFGSLEVWRLGGAPEVEARAVAYGDDVTSRCAAITVQAQRAKPSTAKDTKNHKGTQRLPVWETADYGEHRGTQRRQRGTEAGGVLPPAGLPVCFRSQRTQRVSQRLTESTARGAGRACAQGARPARRAWRGMAGFARHALVFEESSGASPVLYVLYVLLRCPNVVRCRRAGGAGRTKGRGPATPAGVWGSAPYPSILQSANQLIPLCPLWAFVLFVVKNWQSFVSLWKWVSIKRPRGRCPPGSGSLVCCKEHI